MRRASDIVRIEIDSSTVGSTSSHRRSPSRTCYREAMDCLYHWKTPYRPVSSTVRRLGYLVAREQPSGIRQISGRGTGLKACELKHHRLTT